MSRIKISEGKTHLTLEFYSPESANAFSLTAAQELGAVVRQFKKWRRPVLVLSAHPKVFCSGGNLTDYKKLKTKAAGLKVNREIARHLESFAIWPVVKLAVIEGDVLGGGMEWLSCFDFRWCTNDVLLAFWQRKIGLTPGWRGGSRWATIIGEQRVRQLLMDAALLPASAALRLGLVDRIVPAWSIRAQAEQWMNLLGSEILNRIVLWSAKDESKMFDKLWLEKVHKNFLATWSRD